MEFYFFHLMPYPNLPADFYDRYDSAWVTCPNELFDARLGTALYNRYLDEMIYAEELGLATNDDVVVYCRIGERSSHTWFVLQKLLGYDKVRNYDGSWTEWGNLVGAPIER